MNAIRGIRNGIIGGTILWLLLVLGVVAARGETRNFARAGGSLGEVNPRQLAAQIDAATGLQGVEVVLNITPTLIIVAHDSLTRSHDAAVKAVIAAYVYDRDYDLSPEREQFWGLVTTLRRWQGEAQALD